MPQLYLTRCNVDKTYHFLADRTVRSANPRDSWALVKMSTFIRQYSRPI